MAKHRAVALAFAFALTACSEPHEICNDGQDNDHDGKTDCEDSSCAGAVCGPNGLACASDATCSLCSGNGGTAEPGGETSCGDGVDNDCDGLIDCDDPNCQPASSGAPGRVCDAAGHTCSAPDALGHSACGTVSGGGGNTTRAIGALQVARIEHEVLGALGSGYHEQSLVTFEVLDTDGKPYPGVPVKFSHDSQGGSYIGAVSNCSQSVPLTCTSDGATDASGQVGVIVRSGRRFAVLSVRADATAGGATRSLVTEGLTVVGAKPSGASFSLDCRPYNVPAYTVHDCLYSRYKGDARNVECTATLGDRHGNPVAIPTQVSFQGEAGLVIPAAVTPAFDPHESVPGIGQALGVYDVYGAPLPRDVTPFANEASVSTDYYGCGRRTSNPRDGLVTVIALVEGEEGYADLNFNGQHDAGEPFIDLGEPFVDENDNGLRDATEWYLDLNGDGQYTGPNGRWDASTVLWTEARILYTGHPAYARDDSGNELYTRVYVSGTPPAPTAPAPDFLVHVGPPPTTEWYGVFFTDAYLNPMSSYTTFGAKSLAGHVTAAMSNPTGTADSLATTFRMRYCDKPTAPQTCYDGPADQGCRTSPCYLKTEVGQAFAYGNWASLAVTGSSAGEDVVLITTTVEGVSSTFSIGGQCVP